MYYERDRAIIYPHTNTPTHQQGEDKPSPLLWTSLPSHFVGIVGATLVVALLVCGRTLVVALPRSPCCVGGASLLRVWAHPCGRPAPVALFSRPLPFPLSFANEVPRDRLTTLP
jgi:hypothetical protein